MLLFLVPADVVDGLGVDPRHDASGVPPLRESASPYNPPMTAIDRRIRCLIVGLLAALVTAAAWAQPAPESASGWTHKEAVTSRHWMVAAANPLAAAAGERILASGGNAVDAAVAVQMVLGLVEPQSSGIGGGAFLLVHDARRGTLIAWDGRETAPAAARPDRFLRDGKPMPFFEAVVGGRSVGVPGTLRMLEAAHRKHGRLPWARLFDDAIVLADGGFAVSPRLHRLLADERYMTQPRIRDYFHGSDGKPLPVGAILRNPEYARTLRTIAAGGADAFYTGPIAQDIVDTVRDAANPGDMTLADLAGYRAIERAPLCDRYRTYRICGMPLPSSGTITILQMLKMLEPYDMASMGPASFWSVHFVSEAGRLAFADRGVYEADPAFYRAPTWLLDDDYLRARSRLIRVDSSMGRAQPGEPPARVLDKAAWGQDAALDLPSTSHLSIVDRYGNAVAMTTTIENQFGSRLMTAGGFLLNNELTDFSFVPEEDGKPVANRVEAGKRPRSSMAPTIAYDSRGRVAIVAGSPGGSSIINYVAKTLLAIIDWRLDPQEAVALPNFGSRNGPTELERETAVASLAPKLRAFGAPVAVIEMTSGTQAIVREPVGWIGGADPRREGVVLGR